MRFYVLIVAVIAEIEQLWCTPFERHWRRNNPSFIFYVAKQVDIENQRKNMKSLVNNIIQKHKSERVRNRCDLWKYNEYPSIGDQLNNDARYDEIDRIAADRRDKQETVAVLDGLVECASLTKLKNNKFKEKYKKE